MKKLGLGRFTWLLLLCSAVATTGLRAQTLTTVVNFDGNHGANPRSSLVQAIDGNFYGTTYYGGTANYGTVFKMSPGGTLTTLHSFSNADGARPWAGLVQGTDRNFYGVTALGGTLGGGTVFKITSSGTLTTLYNFGGSGGTVPYGTLVQGTDGNFYGTTYQGGTNGHGTIFKITPSGTLTTLYSFAGSDGAAPWAGLIIGSDGNFYGTTYQGGANNDGTVFMMTPAGSLTTLYSFAGTDGNAPYAPVTQGSDGNLYGTTSLGGAYGNGSVFQITLAGALTTLHSFCAPSGCNDGSVPYGGVIQGTDGSFYGTAGTGGQYSRGVVFKITSDGTFTTLHAFNGSEGRNPYAGVVQSSSGNLYGTTYNGGGNGEGSVFSMSPNPYQFVTVPPCRLLDTRNTGPISGGTFQTFNLEQLAQNNNCADLSTANVYSLNVTLIPLNGGPVAYLTIWPTGQNRPVISTMNSLDGRVKANAAIVPAGTASAVNIYVTNTANVVLDIDGFFTAPSDSTLAFYPLPPCRLVDTRTQNGDLGGPYLPAGQERDFPLLQGDCGIPGDAQAYSLNFTAIPHNGEALYYLTVWPTGSSMPVVSTLNNPTATVVANAAMVAAGTEGQIAVFPSNDTDLVVDVDGYFAPAGLGALSLYPVTPCRALDTRTIGSGQPFSGALNPPLNVLASGCAVPTSAQAYVFNATVVPSGSLSYLTLWPDGQGQPVVSTLNALDGSIMSNMAVVPSSNGKIDAYAAGLTQLVLDISSYFAP